MRSLWKPTYIELKFYKNWTEFIGKKYKSLITYSRCKKNCTILPNFVGKQMILHNGKTVKPLLINTTMVNHKLGEFILTKKLAIFVKKKKKK